MPETESLRLTDPPSKAAPWNRPLWRDWVFWVILGLSAAAAIFGIIPLLGIPGAIICAITVPLLGLGEQFAAAGPEAWGAAIYLTILVPPVLPLSYAIAWHLLRKLHPAIKAFLTLTPPVVVAFILTWAMFSGYPVPPAEPASGAVPAEIPGDR